MKHSCDLERIAKGFANRRRIDILFLLERRPEISVFDIAEEMRGNFRTISEHLRKLVLAGLILKRKTGKEVCHILTERGKYILSFCRMLE